MKKKNSENNNKKVKKDKKVNSKKNIKKVNEDELGKTEVIEISEADIEKVSEEDFEKTEIIDFPEETAKEKSSKEFDGVIEKALSFTEPEGSKKDNKKLFIILGLSVLFSVLILSYFLFFKSSIKFKYDKSIYDVDVFSEFTSPSVTACYGNKIKCKNIDVSIAGDVDTSKIGNYSVVYSAKYKNKVKKFVIDVVVSDKESPVIEVANDSLSVCPNAAEFNIEYSANDNYDGDLTSSVSRNVNDDVLTLSVTDSSNNIASKDIKLVREDLEGPSISLNGKSNIYLSIGSSYSESGASASDNCDGDVSSSISISGGVDTSKAGNYSVTYTAVDSVGNSNSVTRNVYVYPSNGSGGKIVYLTFDDGPSAYTGELLDILARYNVKATFFVTNRNPGYNNFIKRAYEEGHTIALHTSSHNYSQVYASVDAYFNDLNEINETVKNITGDYSHLIRFPGGSSNTVSRNYSIGIMSTLTQMVTDKGYKYFDWNVSSGDADGRSHSSADYANNIINGLGNNSYYIVLQHDTNVNSIRAVSTVIEYGLSHGYTFLPLDMSSPVVHHKVAN